MYIFGYLYAHRKLYINEKINLNINLFEGAMCILVLCY